MVRSSTRPGVAGSPSAARRCRVCADGGCTCTSRMPSWSTAIAAPPPVVVTTPTRRGPVPVACSGMRQRQREGLEHRIGDADAGDAQVLQEGVGHVVLAGECAGVRGRHLGGRGRSAQLVGQHRLAAARGFEGEGAQAVAVVQGFQEQQIAVDGRIVQRRRADLADTQVGLAIRPTPTRQSPRRAPCRATPAHRACCRSAMRRRAGRSAGPARRRPRWPTAPGRCPGSPRPGCWGRAGACRRGAHARAAPVRARRRRHRLRQSRRPAP